ncbi:hypothetical protein [Streptomyces sp. NPDC005407]|uniref:hypothetical protein n=1 Tax=Streptomyces sp. NPDC005407 TaxID=3155340 RepID=UPI0033AB135E
MGDRTGRPPRDEGAEPVLCESSSLSPGCRKIRGGKQYTALIGGVRAAPDSVIYVSPCVSGDASRVVTETRQMIVHVRFNDSAAEVAPSQTPTPKKHIKLSN